MSDQQVVSELIITSDTGGADKYAQAMDGAAQAASRGLDAANGYNAAIAGIGVGALGAVVGLKSLLDYVASANKQLADMATLAKQTGLSLADFQGVQFGGAVAGMTPDQVNAGLQRSAQLLNDAQRNANSLSKEFEANGLSIKNANGQLISQNQLLRIAADLISHAKDPQDAIAIAQMLGFTKEWIPLLEQGAAAMAGLSDEARKAGAVIDDATIEKAADFDKQWRKSSVEWSAYMRAALSEMLPEVNGLIQKAVEFIEKVKSKGGGIDGTVKAAADAILNSAGIDPNQVHTLEVTPEAQASWDTFIGKLKSAKEYLSSLVTLQGEMAASSPDGSTPLLRISSATPFPASQDPMQSSGYPKSGPADFNALQKAIDAADDAAADLGDTFSKVAGRGKDVNDQVDRAINTLRRHVEQQRADTQAIGLGDGALAGFRAQAAETAAVQANGGKETAEQAAQFKKLRDEAIATADGLAKAKIASQIDFSNKTKFLSADDVAIATQLKGIYGNDVPAALASTEAAQIRVVNAQKMLSDGFQDVGKAMFTAFLSGKNIVDAMVVALDNLAKKLSDAAFSNILQGVLSGNAVQATVGVIEAGASALISAFTGDTKAKKAMEDARNAWQAMAGQVTQFNLAAKGFNLGPLSSELNSLLANFTALRHAADLANDVAGAAALNKSFTEGVFRIMDEFKHGADVMTPLATGIKALNDEAAGLEATLRDLHDFSLANDIEASLKNRIAAFITQFQQQFVTGLTARLNTANGNAFLNDTANLLLQHQADLASARDLGNDPSLLAQVAATFHAEAQKIVDDAGLIGPAFDGFIKQFPQLAGVVVQANKDMSASAKQLQDAANATAKSIVDYVNGLYASSSSPLSPQAQLANAQASYNAKLALAQGGNADAQSTITKDAQNLFDAAKAVYASSTGFQSIFSTVTNQLLGLPAVQNTTDPVVQAMRDVLTAINLGNSTQATQTTLASVALTSQATKDNTAAASSLLSTTNSLTTTANSLATTQNALLTSIQSLQSTANTQLTLLQAALAPSTVVVQPSTSGGYSGGGAGVTLQNQMVVALNKIVWNTYQTANNTQFNNMPHGSGLVGGVYAGGGWINGGTPGIDSVRLAGGGLGMPGEFVVRNAVAQANASWLPMFNRTGQMPANDNGAMVSELRSHGRMIAMMLSQLAQITAQGSNAVVGAIETGSKKTAEASRMARRNQRAA